VVCIICVLGLYSGGIDSRGGMFSTVYDSEWDVWDLHGFLF